jgi:hypothetical protein
VLQAYIDESYSDDWFYLAAAIVEGTQQRDELSADWAALLERATEKHDYLGPIQELHSYELLQGEGPWQVVDLHDRLSFAGQALGLLRDHRVEFVIRGMDRAAQRRRYTTLYEPYGMVLTHLMRQVHILAEERSAHARIVCDEIHQHDRHRAMLERHRAQGTPGYNPTKLASVVGALDFVTSHSEPLIQAADLVAYFAHRRASRPHPRRAELRARTNLWRIVEPQIIHEYCWQP